MLEHHPDARRDRRLAVGDVRLVPGNEDIALVISVDFPAPFSPMIPWIVPGMTRIEMSLFACTGPKALDMPLSSMAGAAVACRSFSCADAMAQKLRAGQLSSDM
jgi:hypothetical protein